MSIKIINRYQEGDAYGFPLSGGGFGVAVLMRFSGGPSALGNRFCVVALIRKRFSSMPNLESLHGYGLLDVCQCSMFWDRRFVDGTFVRLGTMPGYSRETWPLPIWVSNLTGHVIELDSGYLETSPSLVPWGTLPEAELRDVLLDMGCGHWDGPPSFLELILTNPNHIQAHTITPEKIETWKRIRERLRAQGTYPPPIPKPWRAPKRKKKVAKRAVKASPNKPKSAAPRAKGVRPRSSPAKSTSKR